MIEKTSLILAGVLCLFIGACSNSDSSVNIPACHAEYSKNGGRDALRKLIEEYKLTITLVKEKDDVFLLTAIKHDVDFVEIEGWVCRAQKKYGRPKDK